MCSNTEYDNVVKKWESLGYLDEIENDSDKKYLADVFERVEEELRLNKINLNVLNMYLKNASLTVPFDLTTALNKILRDFVFNDNETELCEFVANKINNQIK